MTPENAVKQAVREYLNSIGCIPALKAPLVTKAHYGYYFMPGGTGYGVSGIPDFVGHYRGWFFGIETKVAKKDPTPLQWHQINAINVSGGKAFVVRGAEDLRELKDWVTAVTLGINV